MTMRRTSNRCWFNVGSASQTLGQCELFRVLWTCRIVHIVMVAVPRSNSNDIIPATNKSFSFCVNCVEIKKPFNSVVLCIMVYSKLCSRRRVILTLLCPMTQLRFLFNDDAIVSKSAKTCADFFKYKEQCNKLCKEIHGYNHV